MALALWHSLPLWRGLHLRRSLPLGRRGTRCWGWTRRRRSPALSLSLSLSLSVFLRVGARRDHHDCDSQHGCQLQNFFLDRILCHDHIDRSLD
jgi:hypothetical protein